MARRLQVAKSNILPPSSVHDSRRPPLCFARLGGVSGTSHRVPVPQCMHWSKSIAGKESVRCAKRGTAEIFFRTTGNDLISSLEAPTEDC